MIQIISQSTYYQFLMFLRIKHAVFFSLVFPLFLFFVFGNLWGSDNPDYIPFLLSGIIGMTIASDGLFAIGPVVKEYYASGLIKYLRKLPFNILWHFIGLVLSRIISLVFIIGLLCLMAHFTFGYTVSFQEILHLVEGTFIGLFLFSFMGLVITFSGIQHNASTGLINLVYFLMLFTSSTFYTIGDYNYAIQMTGNIFPLNGILGILRGDGFNMGVLIWLFVCVLAFYYLFNRVKFNR